MNNYVRRIVIVNYYVNYIAISIRYVLVKLFLESVADSYLMSCLTLEDPEHGWRLFTDNFKTTIDHHVRSNQPPYINTRLRKAI